MWVSAAGICIHACNLSLQSPGAVAALQLILVSASLKPSTLAAAPAWAEADPVMITAPPPPPGLIHGAQTPATDTATSGQATGRPQMLPSTITHQMLTYDRTMTSMEKLLLKCLRHYKHQGQKVLVFVGDKDKLAQLGERLTADAKSMKVGHSCCKIKPTVMHAGDCCAAVASYHFHVL